MDTNSIYRKYLSKFVRLHKELTNSFSVDPGHVYPQETFPRTIVRSSFCDGGYSHRENARHRHRQLNTERERLGMEFKHWLDKLQQLQQYEQRRYDDLWSEHSY